MTKIINKINLSPKQKIYLTIALGLIILVSLISFVIVPLISKIKKDGWELAQKKQRIESFYENWQILEQSQQDYQSAQNELSALPAILPSSDALKFIVLIEKFAQDTNNSQSVSIIEPAKTKNAPPVEETTNFQISLHGDFPGLIKFLIYLENAPYYNEIKTIGIQRLSAKDNKNAIDGQIDTTLTVSVYK